ncbi:MAG: Rieske 2Fe-2S domain-containing protein [Myxococcales bacterium]
MSDDVHPRIRVRACTRAELSPGMVIPVALTRGANRRPREALVLLGSDGEPRAYLNECRHLPIPIDLGSRRYLTQDKRHLLCGTHGALYRLDDGVCVTGPCLSLALDALKLIEEDGVLYIDDTVIG